MKPRPFALLLFLLYLTPPLVLMLPPPSPKPREGSSPFTRPPARLDTAQPLAGYALLRLPVPSVSIREIRG